MCCCKMAIEQGRLCRSTYQISSTTRWQEFFSSRGFNIRFLQNINMEITDIEIIGKKSISFIPDISCHYMKSGQSACMFRISYGFQCCQYRRYIAEISTFSLSHRYMISTLFEMAICCRFAKDICKFSICLIHSRHPQLSQSVDCAQRIYNLLRTFAGEINTIWDCSIQTKSGSVQPVICLQYL